MAREFAAIRLAAVRCAVDLLACAALLGGCSAFGFDTANCFDPTEVAYQGHTTLAEAGLPPSTEAGGQLGSLSVTANPVPLPQAPSLSSPGTDPPMARMYCFHPDGSQLWVRGQLPEGWVPPGAE